MVFSFRENCNRHRLNKKRSTGLLEAGKFPPVQVDSESGGEERCPADIVLLSRHRAFLRFPEADCVSVLLIVHAKQIWEDGTFLELEGLGTVLVFHDHVRP